MKTDDNFFFIHHGSNWKYACAAYFSDLSTIFIDSSLIRNRNCNFYEASSVIFENFAFKIKAADNKKLLGSILKYWICSIFQNSQFWNKVFCAFDSKIGVIHVCVIFTASHRRLPGASFTKLFQSLLVLTRFFYQKSRWFII